MSELRDVRLAMVGYGNVGKAFVRMLRARKGYLEDELGIHIVLTGIARSTGSVACSEGIPLDAADERATRLDPAVSALDMLRTAPYDVMVELTPTVVTDGQPAIEHVRTALSRGSHVITANKGPIAWAYRELHELACEKGVSLRHESVVMDGTPVFSLLEGPLLGCQVTEVRGVLNTTTNFVLGQLEDGLSFDEALSEGRRRGFVEADPSLDIDGWDATVKLTALMNVLMEQQLTPLDIDRTGIRTVTAEQVAEATATGKRIKLVCHGWLEDGKARGSVAPTLVDRNDLMATINGTSSCLTITTDLMGPISVVKGVHEPEIDQTAYGVFGDLLRIVRRQP